MAPHLTFFYDVVCPYAYVASKRIELLARLGGAELEWVPVLLGGIYKSIQAPDSPSEVMAAPKARLNALDMYRQAELAEVLLQLNARHPQRSVEAMRLLVAAPDEIRPALTHALYEHYQVAQGSLDPKGLAPIASAHGVDISLIDAEATKQALYDNTRRAVEAGAFGVPTILLDDHLYFGADRLDVIADRLGVDLPTLPMPDRAAGTIEFFHDFASPFAYLAAMRIDELVSRTGATLRWTPMLLGAVFNTIGTATVPIMAMSQSRREWMGRDLHEWAEHTGVPFRFTSTFPLRTVLPLRVSLLEPRTIRAIYEAAWLHDLDIGKAEVLSGVLTDAGFDAQALIAGTQDPKVKQELKDGTSRALEAGVCGAPTFLVDDTVLIWGQDRMDMLERAVRGWRPKMG